MRKSSTQTLLFVLAAYLSVAIGKGFAMLIISGGLFKGMAMYMLVDLFNIVMVALVILFLRKRDGLLRDMEKYFEE